MKTISSRTNPHIKALVALKKTKGRTSQSKFIAEGLRVCTTLIKAGYKPVQLYAVEAMIHDAQKYVDESEITLVTADVMEKISQATSPSGLLAVFNIPKKPKTEKLNSGIVLANICDPGNMGTLIRTAAAMNLTSVVLVEGADVWSHKVVQSTAGTIAQVDIFIWSWEKLLKLKGKNQLIALVARNGQGPEILKKSNSLIVIGNEAHGLPREWENSCDKKVTLPMPGRAESLNASVAGSIAMYLVHT